MGKYWTSNFKEFKKKVESIFGDIVKLSKDTPDIYAHQVLAHGFMEYCLTTKTKTIKENYLKWTKENNLNTLLEEGWEEFRND